MNEAPATTSKLQDASDKCAGCHDKPAGSLSCPTCLKLGIKSTFCSQDCFKTNWNTHKQVHVKAQEPVYVNGVEGGLSVRDGSMWSRDKQLVNS